jgi:hypothetical protein
MATVRHVTSSSELRKSHADGFLFNGVYNPSNGDSLTYQQKLVTW